MARQRAFRLEDLFSNNGVPPGGDPSDPNDPNAPGGPNTPTPEPDPIQIQVPQPGGLPGPDPGDGSGILDPSAPLPSLPRGGPESAPLPLPPSPVSAPGFPPMAPAASPTSATAPGSFANPGSNAARPLQPFNYRSLFDARNQTQGSLIPGARVPSTPANIAPDGGAPTGGQSESAITRALRRMRG